MSKYQNVEISKFHKPVLLKEVIALLNLKSGDNAIDATLDGGGHAEQLLQAVAPDGKVLGIEQDTEMIQSLKSEIRPACRTGRNPKFEIWKNLIIAHGNFRNIDELAGKYSFKKVKAILFDLGLSRWHLEESGRGFSFQKPEEPILMKLDARRQEGAANILNTYPKTELVKIFKEFGEVRAPHHIAEKILLARKRKRICSVGDLLEALRINNKRSLAKIFQALRIAVNEELAALEEGLRKGFDLLSPGGRIAVISYHSLEDRIVKKFFLGGKAVIVTKKPMTPLREEIFKNPSARSAKLRVLQK